ncbi:hypothetical protein HMF7854_04325 [Sphingomonas ginkgonis]|uniref:Uncharacterized protein n=1 Tax=Sphingomonas ginkgonis TaxID=2315330 RepID=A0A3R9Y4R2_9SPHN|nr:hypothetical protein [Sphingomonas ginkgonis]RST30136.1 hypothetical protein HMF7854_04325 [Sphingomonas ginkgonis]
MLSPAQRRALARRQLSLVGPPSIFGPGTTLAALRRRGLIVGRQPHAELTTLGERVCRSLDRKENRDG